MPRSTRKVAPVRGQRVRFIGGVYKGKEGWRNTARESTNHSMFVIIDEDQAADKDADFATRVKKDNVAIRSNVTPQTWEHYLVQEDLKVAHNIAKMAQSMAEAGVKEASADLLLIIKVCIDMACEEQAKKGDTAKYSATALKIADMIAASQDNNQMNV